MTWARALTYVAVWLVLGVVYVASHRETVPTEVDAEPLATAPSYLGLRAADIVGVDLEVGGRHVRAARRGGRWFVVEPTGGRVSGDLIEALVSAIVDAEVEVIGEDEGREAEFGLDRPTAILTFEGADGKRRKLTLGTKNPAQTAVYARAEGSPSIVLVGLNVEYYVGLVLEASQRA